MGVRRPEGEIIMLSSLRTVRNLAFCVLLVGFVNSVGSEELQACCVNCNIDKTQAGWVFISDCGYFYDGEAPPCTSGVLNTWCDVQCQSHQGGSYSDGILYFCNDDQQSNQSWLYAAACECS
jgi:hypothetical protein